MTVAGDDRRACEITRELGQRIVDVAGMLVRVQREAVSDVADAFGPPPEHVNQVVGVFRLAPVSEGQRFEDYESGRPADRNDTADEAVAYLRVLLVVEQADGQPDIEVVGAGMGVAGDRVRADPLVDQKAGHQASDDAQVIHQRAERHRDGQAH